MPANRGITLGRLRLRYGQRFKNELATNSISIHEQGIDALIRCFGADRIFKSIRIRHMPEFWKFLIDEGTRTRRSCEILVCACRDVFSRVLPMRKNPYRRIKVKDYDLAPSRYVSEDEMVAICRNLPNRHYVILVQLCRYAGLRGSEAMALTKERIVVDQAHNYAKLRIGGNDELTGKAKARTTKKRERQVPLQPWHYEDLISYAKPCKPKVPILEGMLSRNRGQRASIVRAARDKAGIEPYGAPLHALRASWIRDMCADNFDPMRVATWAGTSPSVIAMHYSPVTPIEAARFRLGPKVAQPK